MIRLRFAPSPTGYLHIGNARTALFNWLHARRFGGKFVLRIEDTDTERSRHEYVVQLIADLRWLGMDWDEGPDVGGLYGPYRQSERIGIYKENLARLVARGLAYRCYCTVEELEQRRSAAMAAGQSPAYDNRCRALSAADIARFETEGRRPSYRFKVSGEKVVFNDLIHGHTEFDTSVLGDFVVMKSDGWPTFHFAVVVDDALMKITHVLRGVGHLPNTPLHILLFAALGYDVPQFAHMSLTHGADGHVLSKRHGAVALKDYRALGYLPEALANYIALLGWSPRRSGASGPSPTGRTDGGAKGSGREAEIFSMEEARTTFDMGDLNKAASTFDQEKLDYIAGYYMRHADLERLLDLALPYLNGMGLPGPAAAPAERDRPKRIVDVARPYLSHMAQITEHVGCFRARPALTPEVRAHVASAEAQGVLRRVAERLDATDPLSAESFVALVRQVQAETQVKGKALYIPLRLALTGREHGPELHLIAPILGAAECRERILAALDPNRQLE